MAVLVSCIDTLMDSVLAGKSAVKNVMKADFAPSSESSQTKTVGGFMLFSLIVTALRFTDWDISIVQALSSMCMFAGFVLTTVKVAAYDSAAGISVRTLEMFALTLFTRLCSTLFMMGYLPDDYSGHHVFQFFDVCSLVAVIRLLYVIHHNHQDTYDRENDLHTIGYTIPASFMLAFFVHPHLNRSLVFDTVYTAATVLDTFCMLPQLFMMTKKGGKVESLLTNFVVLQFASRVCVFIFWLDAYEELADGYYGRRGEITLGGDNTAGYMFLGLSIVQLFVSADFIYYWVKAKISGDVAVTLPEV